MFAQKSVHPVRHPHRSACPPGPYEQHLPVERSRLAYNLTETREEFQARQRRAYDAGRHAWRERRMPAYLIPFYESLVERVGTNTYTWVSEDTLAEAFQVDVSTIKRWIAKLVQAGLIRRQRQFASSSRTYITAYDPTTILLDGEADAPITREEGAMPGEAQGSADQGDAHASPHVDQETITTVVSFRRTSKPSFGADLHRDSSNTDHLNHFGGGGRDRLKKPETVAPEILYLLEQEGVSQFYLAPMLAQKSFPELKAISTYLDKQHNVRERGKLFAALAYRNFGAQLLAGRTQPEPQRGTKGSASAHINNHLKYVSGALAPYIQGGSGTHAEPASADPILSAQRVPPHGDSSSIAGEQIWQQVQDHLRHVLPDSEFLTWFDQAILLDLDPERAVIGTPNIFVREKVEGHYQEYLVTAFQHVVGYGVTVQVVIGG